MTVTEHRIETADAKPIWLPPYTVPHTYREIVRDELKEMERDGIIERSSSEWSAPIILVKKKDNTLRMCVDYCHLNSVSQMLINHLGDAKFITTLDLFCCYWQVTVRKEDQHKTAFTTQYWLFQSKVMTFALQGPPKTFQRIFVVPEY